MKLLRESPVEFLESFSRPPEKVYLASEAGMLGTAVIAGTPEGICALSLGTTPAALARDIRARWGADTVFDVGPFDREFLQNLCQYLDGGTAPIKARVLSIGLTPFTIAVHRLLTMIPYGETRTYGEIAAELGKPGAARAVGGACGRNRVLLAVPCHRVITSHGLGGFGAGPDLKRKLLEHERAFSTWHEKQVNCP